MYSRLHRRTGAVIASLLLTTGCVQATRHSNTMYFGTNTTFGIKAGASTGEVPEVVVGYDRQEAVIMPLLANTVEVGTAKGDTRNRLSPCRVENPIAVSGGEYAVHPCSFVAFRDGSQDSYSVLASFGAEFSGKANTSVEASGGLAQYFATGMAAQILAAKGGAALVATGSAARESAETPADQSIAALVKGSSEFNIKLTEGSAAAKLENRISQKIRETSASNLVARLTAFDTALGINSGAVIDCASLQPSACAEWVDVRDIYADYDLVANKDKVEAALVAWAVP